MEVFDIHSSPTPEKITSSLRHVKSEEQLQDDEDAELAAETAAEAATNGHGQGQGQGHDSGQGQGQGQGHGNGQGQGQGQGHGHGLPPHLHESASMFNFGTNDLDDCWSTGDDDDLWTLQQYYQSGMADKETGHLSRHEMYWITTEIILLELFFLRKKKEICIFF